MRKTFVALLILGIGLWCLPVEAGWVQYLMATGHVTGGPTATAEELAIPPGYAIINDPTLDVTTPVWPIPAGCAAGDPNWTQLSTGNVLPLMVRVDFVFFRSSSPLQTACVHVGSWPELKDFVDTLMIRALNTKDFWGSITLMNDIYLHFCSGADASLADCVAMASDLTTLNKGLGNRGGARTFLHHFYLLGVDALTFRSAQGW